MNKETMKNLALILLLGITAFSAAKYVSELKTRFRLEDGLTSAQSQIILLNQEKQNLLQELEKEKEAAGELSTRNADLKNNLRASKTRMKRLLKDKARLEEIDSKFAVLKAENRALIAMHKRYYEENQRYKFKLGSISELKNAIRELKAQRQSTPDIDVNGNQGYLTKDGQLTSEKVRIEVIPAKIKE